MVRFGFLIVGILSIASISQAHFVFVVPDAKNSQKAIVVFSDELAPDENVSIDKIGGIKLFARDEAGKVTPLPTGKAAHALTLDVSGKGHRLVFGSLDYGVLQKGDSKPYLLRYHPKAIMGAADSSKVGNRLPIEVVPAIKAGKVRFQVLSKGKPMPATEITIIPADESKRQKVTTDSEGFTPEFDAKGRFGVWTRAIEASAGELAGKKYEEVRNYATLVVDFDAK